METTLTLLVYDVSCNRRRRRLHKLLKEYGTPVQKSAFEARLTSAERKRVVERSRRLLEATTDRLYVYGVPAGAEAEIEAVGRPRPKVVHEQWVIV